jgi:hypothetical protein
MFVYDIESMEEIVNFSIPGNEDNFHKLNENLAAINTSDSLLIYNITDPLNVYFVGGRELGNIITAQYEVIRDTILVASYEYNIQFWNISNPDHWQWISDINDLNYAASFSIDVNNMIITDFDNIYYYNIEDVSNPALLDTRDVQGNTRNNLNLFNRLYLMNGDSCLQYYAIETDSLRFLDQDITPGRLNSAFFLDDYIHIGTTNRGFMTWDISDLYNPQFVSNALDSTYIYQSTLNDTMMSVVCIENESFYCTLLNIENTGGLSVWNTFEYPYWFITNESGYFNLDFYYFSKYDFDEFGQPVELASVEIQDSYGNGFLAGNRAYLFTQEYCYLVDNIDSAANMELVQEYNDWRLDSITKFTAFDNYIIVGGYIGDEMLVYRIDDNYEFDLADTVPQNGFCDIDVENEILILGNTRCYIYDISELDENHVYSITSFSNWSEATDLVTFSRNGNDYFLLLEESSASIYRYWPSTKVEEHIIKPIVTLRNYPNPFNPSTTISFSLPEDQLEKAELTIYNLKGQKVRQFSILNSQFSIVWDGTDQTDKPVSSGIYFARLKAGKLEKMRKMLLLK